MGNLGNLGNIGNLFDSKLNEYGNRLKTWGKWLFSSDNENFKRFSDANEVKLSEEELETDGRLKSIDGTYVNSKSAETRLAQLNFAEKLLRKGRKLFSEGNFFRLSYESVVGLGSCLLNHGFTDPDLGEFPLNASTYCSLKCGKYI